MRAGSAGARRTWYAAGAMMLLAPVALTAAAQSVAWTGSLYGATGRYIFAERSTDVALSNGLAITVGPLRLSGSIPVVFQSTPWVALGGTGTIPTGGGQHGVVGQQSGTGGFGRRQRVTLPSSGDIREIGIGDPVAFASLDVVDAGDGALTLNVTGSVKVPLASADDGFGTGEWDWGAGAGLSTKFGSSMLFVDAAYWQIGDMPSLPLRDVLTGGAAIGRLLGEGPWSGMLTFSGSQATIAGSDPPMQAGVIVSRRGASESSVSVGLSFGLTTSSPDVAASIGWRVPIARSH